MEHRHGFYVAKDYPEHLPRVRFKDATTGKTLVFLTNNTTACPRHCPALQESLAGGIVLQMDQAASANQALFGQQRERGEDASLVRHRHLRFDRHCQKGAGTQILAPCAVAHQYCK